MEKGEANVQRAEVATYVGRPFLAIVSHCFLSTEMGLRAVSEPCLLPLSVAVHT